jgi:hypothetical protein
MDSSETSRTVKPESSSSRGLAFVLANTGEAKRRISNMLVSGENSELSKKMDEIWETYCDIESAIAMSKLVFGANNKLGVTRKISVSGKFDPMIMSWGEFRAKLVEVDSNLSLARSRFQHGSAEDAIELARKARDELKIMLISHRRSENKRRKKEIHTP